MTIQKTVGGGGRSVLVENSSNNTGISVSTGSENFFRSHKRVG
jgi:hypothetical protein